MRKVGNDAAALLVACKLQRGRNFVAESCNRGSRDLSQCALQRGRNFIVAERRTPRSSCMSDSMLQRDRNFIVAERRRARVTRGIIIVASTGPQLHRCGKEILDAIEGTTGVCFNGAATSSLRKGQHGDGSPEDMGTLQWGRNFIVAESCPGARRTAPACAGFNGAATSSLRKAGMPSNLVGLLHACFNSSHS